MAIIAEQSAPFGGRVTDIVNKSFRCVVTTAKEGVFRGLSTIVYEGTGRPCAKLFYASSTGKRDRQQFHGLVSRMIDEAGDEGSSLEASLNAVIGELRGRGILADAINLA